ncbi:PBS lyase [Pseudomonas sp. HR96]|uniref:PBS lyase n=1 Tax=Pseudomonas sp. HR96 TaxID=1027966 RepID=UPI002A7503DB|nr:PBS lyase [Pseudomonas sp. HR96]WPP01691.1 PBS lyase [Pseudomonas sp. HR96]
MALIKQWLTRLRNHQAPVTPWAAQRLDEAMHWLGNAEQRPDWLAFSTHPNGFIREVAVRTLRDQPSPSALAALIERLNDWVPQVRDLARQGLDDYLSPAHVQTWLLVLEPLMALASRYRADHNPTLRQVRQLLEAPEARDAVHAHFLTRQGRAARYLFELLLEQSFDRQALLTDALAHRELTVRLAAVAASQRLPNGQALELLEQALPHQGAKVRVCVIRALLPLLEQPQPLLRQALLDSARSIRRLARWAAPAQDVDPHALLLERQANVLPEVKREWLGILGLAAELEVQLQPRWVTAATRSRYPSVRQAVIRQLGESHSPELLAALDDPADSVFLAAANQLNSLPWASLQARLDAKLDKDWHELSDQRRQALMGLRPQWQQVAYLLTRMTAEPTAGTYWAQQISRWCEQQYRAVDPTTGSATRAQLIEQLRGLVSAGLVSRAEFARVAT